MVTIQNTSTAPPNVRDRCDSTSCNAKALVNVEIKGGNHLVFCGHHFDSVESDLLGVMLGVCDTREERT